MNVVDVIKAKLVPVKAQLSGIEGLATMFERCFLNTLETTLKYDDNGDTFVITGDIPAMWLRDSTAQVLHYVRFADAPEVGALVAGLIRRQARDILYDAYANAFNRDESAACFSKDISPDGETPIRPRVWERKYEIDSLCYPLLLAHAYWRKTGDTAPLKGDFEKAVARIIDVFTCEQDHASSPYIFIRTDCPPSDTLANAGQGAPVAHTGMTWSGFRPSDDACKYGYLVPSNLFAVKALGYAAEMMRALGGAALAARAEELAGEIQRGIDEYAHVEVPGIGDIYAYEVDGNGNVNLMDDANVPSLLSLPYLGVCLREEPMYLRTRAFALSGHNPYYYEGIHARGIGSPHTPDGYIWPIALCMQAMTSNDVEEISGLVRAILECDAGTGLMHESFNPDDPNEFTREWFAWANSLFGELLYSLYERELLSAVLA